MSNVDFSNIQTSALYFSEAQFQARKLFCRGDLTEVTGYKNAEKKNQNQTTTKINGPKAVEQAALVIFNRSMI